MIPQFKRYLVPLASALMLVNLAAADSDRWPAVGALTYLGFSALIGLVPAALISAVIDIVTHYYCKEQTAMAGYANRTVYLGFPEFTEAGDREVHVVIRNPRLMPPGELTPQKIALDANGKPIDLEAAKYANNALMAKLVIGWHVYDTNYAVDEDGNELPQERLPLPATAELVAKLPTRIFAKITTEITGAFDPQ
jgi:hypothetical protein